MHHQMQPPDLHIQKLPPPHHTPAHPPLQLRHGRLIRLEHTDRHRKHPLDGPPDDTPPQIPNKRLNFWQFGHGVSVARSGRSGTAGAAGATVGAEAREAPTACANGEGRPPPRTLGATGRPTRLPPGVCSASYRS
ncbi:hypothetical protein GCM10017688_25100 [Streptomyces ramulosus]